MDAAREGKGEAPIGDEVQSGLDALEDIGEDTGTEPVLVPENGDFRYEEDEGSESPEEEDDNPYGDSDEALPDDKEEAAMARALRDAGK